MKMPFDTLVTDRAPFVFIERSTVGVSGGSLVAKSKEGNRNIPVSNIHCLMLGNGTSITAEGASLCAKHNCYIAFVKGGVNTHSIWHAGRYSNPKYLVAQTKNHLDPAKRLHIAKLLMKKRVSLLNEFQDILKIERIEAADTISELLGLEGALTKQVYSRVAAKHGLCFKRDGKSRVGVNGSLTICNNALYNFVATLVCSAGLHPSIGFLHGQTRRGGLVFDIADIFKYPLYLESCFQDPFRNTQQTMRNLSASIGAKNNSCPKEIFKIFDVCLS